MKVLFDQNVPINLRAHLPKHEVSTAALLGWSELKNGELLQSAEEQGFEVFVTGDRNLQYQQKVLDRKLAILELTRTNWPLVRPHISGIVQTVDRMKPGEYRVFDCAPGQ